MTDAELGKLFSNACWFPASMGEDELTRLMQKNTETFTAIFAHLRHLFEADGIEMAAQYIRGSDEIGKVRIADKLSLIATKQRTATK